MADSSEQAKYEILGIIGEGAFGKVFLVEDADKKKVMINSKVEILPSVSLSKT